MKPIELRELDTWIHSNVLGADQLVGVKKRGYWYRPHAKGYTDRENEAWHLTREEAKKHEYLRGEDPVTICEFDVPHYTSDPAAALAVLKICAQDLDSKQSTNGIAISYAFGMWECVETDIFDGIRTEALSLELSICLFAKELFTVSEKESGL